MKKLNDLLADLIVLNHKTYTMHWNAKGDEGFTMHKLTESLYEGYTEFIDEVGEKIKMQNEKPVSSLKDVLSLTSVKELTNKDYLKAEIIKTVIEDLDNLEKTISQIKADHMIQPLFDELNMFIDKQRYLFKLSA